MTLFTGDSVRARPAEQLQTTNECVIVIEPASGWVRIDWRELYHYRDLFYFLIWRSIKVRYAQSALGIGWAVIQPLFSMLMFTIVFGKLANVSSDGAPYSLFSLVALVPWIYFSNTLSEGTASLVSNANMLSKVYFPRIMLPLSIVIAKLVDLTIGMAILLGLMVWYRVAPTAGVLMLPLLIALMIIAAAGITMWLAALAVQYRDVNYGMGFAVQLLMYASPIVYPTSLIAPQYQLAYALNPVVGVVEGFRSVLLETRAIPWHLIGMSAVSAVLLAVTGALYFRRREKIFADVA